MLSTHNAKIALALCCVVYSAVVVFLFIKFDVRPVAQLFEKMAGAGSMALLALIGFRAYVLKRKSKDPLTEIFLFTWFLALYVQFAVYPEILLLTLTLGILSTLGASAFLIALLRRQ